MIFLSDLDRTLIFSYKRLSEDNVCVETMDGKKLSYMTPHSAELFGRAVQLAEFIPITTRSVSQYGRISFPEGFVPKYALCDNGATMLIDGEIYPRWRENFREASQRAEGELARCREYLRGRSEIYLETRFVDDVFLFAKSSTPDETLSQMKEYISPEHTDLFSNGDKIYVIPKGIGKAEAMENLRKMFPNEPVIAAGDSLFDREMLMNADASVVKCGELAGIPIPEGSIAETEGDDPDFTLKAVLKLCDKFGKNCRKKAYSP